jgi:hypothetical protein
MDVDWGWLIVRGGSAATELLQRPAPVAATPSAPLCHTPVQ